MKFPIITEADIEESRITMMADIYPVTVCSYCGSENWGMRLGCHCGRLMGDGLTMYMKTNDGRYLILGEEVSLLDEQ